MTPIPLFVELCAGTAALSLRLHRDGARPPVSRMGSKSGYSDALLRVLGLTPGQRAAAYLWCEPDPGVRLLLHAYRDAGLAKAAAAIIRSWASEDPRALWERLRAEGPPRLPDGDVEAGEVARWTTLQDMSLNGKGVAAGMGALITPVGTAAWSRHARGEPVDWKQCHGPGPLLPKVEGMPHIPAATITPDARAIDPREVARWAQITASNRLIHTAWSDAEGRWINTGDGGATFGGATFCSPPERTAAAFDATPGDVPAAVAPDAREVDPREVARWAIGQKWTQPGREPFAAFNDVVALGRAFTDRHGVGGVWVPQTPDKIGARFDAAPGDIPALIHTDARTIDPPALPPGTVAYLDGPYENTTQYAHLLPRAEQVALARRWAAAGATVAVSEAEPIPELVAEGWYSVDITNQRVGQSRTFSKQQHEHVTLNRPPAWVPPVQGRLF